MDVPPDLVARIHSQDGVVTTGQALEHGLEGRDVGRLRARGALVRIRWGAYALRAQWEAWSERERHLALSRAVGLQLTAPFTFSHQSAAVAHDLPLHGCDLDEVHVTRDNGSGLTRHQAGVWHHDGPLGPVTHASGLPVTTLARTAFDFARIVHLPSAVVTADAVLARGVKPAELEQECERALHWPGAARARRAFERADGRSESPGESLARLAFGWVSLPAEDLQMTFGTDRGSVRTDFVWASKGVVGEFDGRVKYGRLLKPGQDASEVLFNERQRELAIERTGWKVVRFTWSEIHDLRLVRERLLEAFGRPVSGMAHRTAG